MLIVNADSLPRLTMYGTMLRSGGWGHEAVTKPHHLLVLANTGSFQIHINGRCYPMLRDSALLIPRGTPYSLESHEAFEHSVIHFDMEISEDAASCALDVREGSFAIAQYIKADVSFRSNMERAVLMRANDSIDAVERRMALLRALLCMARLTPDCRESKPVKRMKEYFESCAPEPLDLSFLSTELGYTKQYLIRIFKRETGKTPMAYYNELRLGRGAALLLNEEKSIAEVAQGCGFDDCNYFSRAFRRCYGISPSEYRKRKFII